MYTFEESIEKIDKEISIKKEERESYSKDFDIIRKRIFDIMGMESGVFKYLYNGPSLFGSYLENLKIDKPDEFDVHFVLNLPHKDKMHVKRDPLRPGFVNLDITHVMSHTKHDSELRSIYLAIEKLVDEDGTLDRNKLQKWIEEILTNALSRYGNNVRCDNGLRNYILTYSKCGTAHTIKAYSPSRKMSIDFVPAFQFTKNAGKVLDTKFPSNLKESEKIWFAVPKPTMDVASNRNLTFSVCAPKVEKHLLNDNFNLKPSLRLLKSLRDKMGDDARKLKSYFIKTIYLFENDKQSEQFWKKPKGYILLHMLDVLIYHLDKSNLPSYWAPDQNMFDSINAREIATIGRLFKDVKSKLQTLSRQSYVNYGQIRPLFDDPSDTVNAEKA